MLHAGIEPDLKPFHPHITVGRPRGVTRGVLHPFLRKYQNTEFDLWKVTSFTLFSSVLSPDGATHSAEMRTAL